MESRLSQSSSGFWGEVTSTIDWCENNYEVTSYIAEFWNTVSNVVMILPPIYGMYYAVKDKLDRKFFLCHLLLLTVGLGSWCFHMTLLYEMQLFDELPMIFGSTVILYSQLSLILNTKGWNLVLLRLAITTYSLLVTVIYLVTNEPIFFEVAYGIIVVVMFGIDVYLVRTKHCSVPLMALGGLFYLIGAVVWNVDNIYCGKLNELRTTVLPTPLGTMTQLHAWWHLLAGYGSYMHILFVVHSGIQCNNQKTAIEYSWWGLVHVRPVLDLEAQYKFQNGESSAKSVTNGIKRD